MRRICSFNWNPLFVVHCAVPLQNNMVIKQLLFVHGLSKNKVIAKVTLVNNRKGLLLLMIPIRLLNFP